MTHDQTCLREAIHLARQSITDGGGPFGAVVVVDGAVVGRGMNRVVPSHDPTAHAEVMAIRDACRRLGRFSLAGGTLYASCEPCPMCFAAIYWARLDRVVFAASRVAAAAAGFDDALIETEAAQAPDQRRIPFAQDLEHEAAAVFDEWRARADKTAY